MFFWSLEPDTYGYNEKGKIYCKLEKKMKTDFKINKDFNNSVH